MMTIRSSSPHRACNRLVIAAALALAAAPSAIAASEVAEALSGLATNSFVTREISLKEFGIREPIVLSSSDARHELFLPVPAGVPIQDATLELEAGYLNGDGGRTTFVLSLDGYPVSSRSFTQPEGNAGLTIGVDGSPRDSGFVRVGAVWTSIVSEHVCASERTSGNILKIAPTTRLRYRYDGTAVRDLASAWTALPMSVTVVVAGSQVSKDTYDAAWRIGVALERTGKQVVVKALPSPGDEVDLSGVVVPDALKAIPAFRNLAGATRYTIADPAEVGALLVLGAAPVQAHIAIADQEFQSKLKSALAALEQQVEEANARAALANWRSKAMTAADEPLASGAVLLTHLAGQPLIAVAPDAGAQAAGLFDEMWRKIPTSRSVVLHSVNDNASEASAISLARLGVSTATFDVVARGDWSATFNLGKLASDGRVPSRLEVDVTAAPGATTTPPVASVFVNDILLGAKRLAANGQPERIEVEVPSYTLRPQSVLRVSFQRQVAGEPCRETPQAYPVSILPTSRLLLDKAPAIDDFTGVIPRLAGSADLIVPDAWLGNAATTLPTAIRFANVAGLSPVRASFTTGAASVTPSRPFLALDVAIDGQPPRVKVEGNRLTIAGRESTNLLDVAGLDSLAIVSVVRSKDHAGLVYNTVGSRPLAPEASFALTRGDVAVIGAKGVLAEIDTRDPFGSRPASDDRKTWIQALWGKAMWSGFAAASGLFLLIVLRARQVRRRHTDGDH